ncbi:MAG: DEAD/DEAH box helicase, partial [Clostridiales Family XIII bacterium]|nr:DEAD/DEAH box helicase [Clostridiales Family XIII bacterium]
LDEADRMLDMGFRPALDRILKTVPEERQTVMFSATMSPSIQAIAQAYQKNVQRILLEQETLTVDSVRQYYAQVEKKDKESTLARLIKDERFDLSLVFVARKHRAADVARALNANGIRAAALHGDLRQSQRDRVMGSYRSGELDVLVATDVAARGIDVKNIDAVINFDIPQDGESYVHRIGRTGRAAETGVSYTFVMSEEMGDMKAIMRLTHTDVARINLQLLDGFVSGKGKKAVTPALVGVVNRPDAFERVLRTENRRQQTTERPASSGRKRRSRGQKRTRYA